MVDVPLGSLNEHVQHLFTICQPISLNSVFRENGRLTARNPLPGKFDNLFIYSNSYIQHDFLNGSIMKFMKSSILDILKSNGIWHSKSYEYGKRCKTSEIQQ